MNVTITTLRGFAHGRVQGVFFRAQTQKKAMELGIHGWVRNVMDGRVEILISGSSSAVESMRAWLAKGPTMARVDLLQLDPVEPYHHSGFQIRY